MLVISVKALERLIIGKYFGGFNSIRIAFDLSETFIALESMRPEDVDNIFEHQKRLNSHIWVECTQEIQRQHPKVLRILRDMKDLPNHVKYKRGMNVEKNPTRRNPAVEYPAVKKPAVTKLAEKQPEVMSGFFNEKQKPLAEGLLW